MKDCIFCKIRDGEIIKEFIYEDEDAMVFPDISPVKPVHLLIIPKKHIEDFMDLKDLSLLKRLNEIIKKMVKENNLEDKGYRVVYKRWRCSGYKSPTYSLNGADG